MAEEATITTTTTTTPTEIIETANPLVSKPLVTLKPYDDDMMELYSEEEASVETPPKEEAPKVEPEERPKIEAKSIKNDQTDDSFEKVVIKKEINGKPVEFTVADAIKAKMTHEETMRNLDRRATYLKQRETAWQDDQNNFKTKVSNVIQAARNGDFASSIRALAKLAKGNSDFDVTAFEQQYFEQLDGMREIYSKMSPEERKAYFAERALAEAKAENQKYVQKEEIEKARTALQTKVTQLMKENNIPEDDFWGNYKTLIDEHVGEGKKYSSKEEVTAEEVITYSNEVRDWTKVFEASEKTGIEDEAILEELKKIATLNPDYTPEDLAKIIDKAGFTAKLADSKTVENLNRKAGKSRLAQEGTATKKRNDKLDGYDEESLDFLYRKQPKIYRPIQR